MTKEKILPIDRGWAWIIVIACFMQLFITLGIIKSLGIIFVEVIDKYNGTASSASLMYSISTAVSLFCAPLITAACEIFSCRAVCMLGGTLLCIAFVIASQCTSLIQIVFSYGLVGGLGVGCSLTPIPLMIGKYFHKKRAFANGLAFSGSGMGSMIIPVLMYYIISEYLLHGSLLIFGAIIFQTVIFASLHRPLTFYKNLGYKPKIVETEMVPLNHAEHDHHANHVDLKLHVNFSPHSEEVIVASPKHPTIPEDEEVEIAPFNRGSSGEEFISTAPSTFRRQSSEEQYFSARENLHRNFTSEQSVYFSARNLAATSVSDIPQVLASEVYEINEPLQSEISPPNQPAKKVGYFRLMNRLCYVQDEKGNVTCLFSFELLKNPEYMLVVGGVVLALNGFFVAMIVPPHSEDLGFTKAEAAVLLSALGAADMCGRLFTAGIGDRKFFKPLRPIAFGIYAFGCSVCVFLIITAYQYYYITILLIFYALFFGAFVSLNPVILADIVGVENLGKAWGIQLFFEGFTLTLSPYLIGALKDFTDSYTASFVYLSISFFFAGILITLSAWLRHKKSALKNST